MSPKTDTLAPTSAEEAAAALREASEAGRSVRVRGGGTKFAWGNAAPAADAELSTAKLARIVEHNAGDFTVVAGAGTPVAELQAEVREAGQRLALDPPLGAGYDATLGGVLATADAGPLRHRFGPPRDLVLGVRVALPDGTVARAGGKVIKNVAGYDLGKLMAGAYGTLGLICEVSLRLHPLPGGTATAIVRDDDPARLAAHAGDLAHRSLEPLALDASWADGSGAVLARFGGSTAAAQARAAAEAIGGEVAEDEEDHELWAEQRERQRSADGVVVRVSTVQTRLADVLAAARDAGGSAVARAGLVLAYVTLPPEAEAVAALRERLAPAPCVVADAPDEVRAAVDVWGEADRGKLALMRRVRERFDPYRTLNPGIYVGEL